MTPAWEIWGKRDPYYGVLSDERFRSARISQSRDEFFATGEAFIERALNAFEQSFGAPFKGKALDFGCGVGRLTMPLARRFDKAVGVDVSPSMLAEARANAAEFTNISFVESSRGLGEVGGGFDFILSYIVFQHIPKREGMEICRDLLSRLRAGGGCFLHFSLKRRRSWIKRVAYWARFNIPSANLLLNLASGRPVTEPATLMEEYSLSDLVELFSDAGMQDIRILTEHHWGATLGASLAARKPPA